MAPPKSRGKQAPPVQTNVKSSVPTSVNASGRPVRRATVINYEVSSQFDSTESLSSLSDSHDSDSGSGSDSSEALVSRYASRKRKRSIPSTLATPPFTRRAIGTRPSSSSSRTCTPLTSPEVYESIPKPIQPTFSFTFNIPSGFAGPLVLNIDGNALKAAGGLADVSLAAPATSALAPRAAGSQLHKLKKPQSNPVSKSVPGRVGFLDLPAELRNDIYKLIFVKESRRLKFHYPDNFQRSAALLATCRQVASEGSSFLYSANEFYFRRNSTPRTPLWSTSCQEVGFQDIQRFLKTIGPNNLAKIRHVFFLLEDATPCLNPQLKNAEDRRYVHDENLKSCIKLLAAHGRLQSLKLGFFGRRAIGESDMAFLNELKLLKADNVEVLARRCHPDWPPLYSNLRWPKIIFSLALDVKSAIIRRKKFYPLRSSPADHLSSDSDGDGSREAKLCEDCGDVHV